MMIVQKPADPVLEPNLHPYQPDAFTPDLFLEATLGIPDTHFRNPSRPQQTRQGHRIPPIRLAARLGNHPDLHGICQNDIDAQLLKRVKDPSPTWTRFYDGPTWTFQAAQHRLYRFDGVRHLTF